MKAYFVVEGRRTERKVYIAWLSHLVPALPRLNFCDDATVDGYFLISAEGYPSIIYDTIPAAIEDINRIGGYQYLVVALDADECSIEERAAEIQDHLAQEGLHPRGANLIIIVQNKCIETWFLGNRKVIPHRPATPDLQEYLAFYNVRRKDPEQMGCHQLFATHAQFHEHYLKTAFRERNLSYSKSRPGHVLDKAYLDELIGRVSDKPTDLASFQVFLALCQEFKDHLNRDNL